MTYSFEEVKANCFEYFKGDELATNVVMNKYLLRSKDGDFLEKDPDDMLRNRIVSEFARIEKKQVESLSYDEIYEAMKDFKYIVPQGSPLFGIGNTEQTISIGNCFVVGRPADSYGGILKRDEELAQIMKRRGGCGIDISTLRPRGAVVNNSARTSDGISCFMERFSNTTKEVAQNGRRGALMISIDCRHPDIEHFINIKMDKSRVTGANISIKWHDDFLKAVENDEQYTLRFPVDSTVKKASETKVVNAKEIWDQAVKANWDSAEPGSLFWDTMIGQNITDCYKDDGFETISTNPCLVGTTKVKTNKGDISIKEIIENGVENYKVLTYNTDTGKLEWEDIVWGDKTREMTDVIKLTLDDDTEIELTPDHRVYTDNRGWIEASELTNEDILVGIDE